jgi:hypothetical protein
LPNSQLLQQLISSAASQNTLKAANKQKLPFISFSDKLLFQQAAAVPNRAIVGFLKLAITCLYWHLTFRLISNGIFASSKSLFPLL